MWIRLLPESANRRKTIGLFLVEQSVEQEKETRGTEFADFDSSTQSCAKLLPTVAGSRSVFQNLRNCAAGSARWDVRRSTMMRSGANLCIGIQVEYL